MFNNKEQKKGRSGIEGPGFIKSIDLKKFGNKVRINSKKGKVNKKGKKQDNCMTKELNKDIDQNDSETIKIKINEELQQAINEYNHIYTLLSDNGLSLFRQRERAVDHIILIEQLINSIANRPKSFDIDLAEIEINKKKFTNACEFIAEELKAAHESAISAGAGIAAGTAVVSLAPSAAMWVATTFGTASTGTAISSLSGAVAQSAALAWLGGGAIATGGGGMAAGNALLALAGPIGWSIAGVSLLTSILLFTSKQMKLKTEKIKEMEDIRCNIRSISNTNAKISELYNKTKYLREELINQYSGSIKNYGQDYLSLTDAEKSILGAIVNNTKSLSVLLGSEIK